MDGLGSSSLEDLRLNLSYAPRRLSPTFAVAELVASSRLTIHLLIKSVVANGTTLSNQTYSRFSQQFDKTAVSLTETSSENVLI